MNKNPRNSVWHDHRWIVGALLGTLGIPVISMAAAQSLVALAGHVPPQLRGAVMVERAPADETVHLSLAVKLDQNLMDQTLEELYGRNAPAQKHYLSSEEFAQKFGLADKRQMLKSFARSAGLTIDAADDQPGSMVVKVSGSASLVEKAFSVRLNHYRNADGQMFRAHETDPMIPVSLVPHLSAVLGLSNNTGVLHPHVRMAPQSAARTPSAIAGGTGPNGSLAPADIKTIYGVNGVSPFPNGSGQTIALFELDGYIPSDLPLYEGPPFNLGSTPVTFVGVAPITQDLCGVNQDQTCNLATFNDESAAQNNGMIEVALDLDMVAALAAGVSQILVYEGLNSIQGEYDTYNKIAADDIAQVISTSWGRDEQTVAGFTIQSGAAFVQAEATVFQQMAAQGQTIFAASGDCGAYDQQDTNGACVTTNGFRVDDPASQPFVTGVGGTSLSGSVGAPMETTWNSLLAAQGRGAGGGGVSLGSIPSFQQGVPGTASQQFRNVPDVALNADPNSGYTICVGGLCNRGFFAGTSAAAPLWAGLTALVNQQRSAAGRPTFGFGNAGIYQIAASTSAGVCFNDAQTGINSLDGIHYKAGVGYDNATGWGSFKGAGLIETASGISTRIIPTSLTNIFAYPNPWDTRKNTIRQITFANAPLGELSTLPAGATIKIFTVSGFWVKTLTVVNGMAIWQGLTNDAGDRVASGLYFYLASDGSTSARGTIAIIK